MMNKFPAKACVISKSSFPPAPFVPVQATGEKIQPKFTNKKMYVDYKTSAL